MQKYAIIYKNIGETPLEALERFRSEMTEKVANCNEVGKCDDNSTEINFWKKVPMTYAGRLDPMAEGELLILFGDECKNKEKYLGLDKEYEVEILFGISTDSHDLLGKPVGANAGFGAENIDEKFLQKYVGKFTQEYPAYSSKTVNGVQLHELARAGELPDSVEMPTKEVEIYSIKFLDKACIAPEKLKNAIRERISLVKGDFRQNEILADWDRVFVEMHNIAGNTFKELNIVRILVRCSSGTYMRSLAHRIGNDVGTGACAYSIKRTKLLGL